MSNSSLFKDNIDINLDGCKFNFDIDIYSLSLLYVSEHDFTISCTNLDYLFPNTLYKFTLVRSKNQFFEDVYLIKFENKEELYNLLLDNVQFDINSLQRFLNFTVIQSSSILFVIYYYLINFLKIDFKKSEYTKNFLFSQDILKF